MDCVQFDPDGQQCEWMDVKYGQISENGTVCHCYENHCNGEVPDISPDTPTTPDPTTTSHEEPPIGYKCFSCGYMELTNGSKIPLSEDYGEIPFCNDFVDSDVNTVYVGLVW